MTTMARPMPVEAIHRSQAVHGSPAMSQAEETRNFIALPTTNEGDAKYYKFELRCERRADII
jgi:hypothetical protein